MLVRRKNFLWLKLQGVPYKWIRKERTSRNSCPRTTAVGDRVCAGSEEEKCSTLLSIYEKENYTGGLMIWILLSRGEKQDFTHTQPSFVKYCFNQSKLKFVSLRRRVISSIYKPTYHADKKGPLLFLKWRTIDHLHDEVILLLRPESLRVLLSFVN